MRRQSMMPDARPPIRAARARIDGISYADGGFACTVVIPGRGIVYMTRRYRREDRDGTHPGMRAMRDAQRWRQNHADD
jgi:hypothetical protein